MVQENFLGQHHTLAEREQFQDGVFLARQVDSIATNGHFT